MTRFLHITDLHLTAPETRDPSQQTDTVATMDRLLALLPGLDPVPDFIVATGDLTNIGDAASYRLLADRLARLDVPVIQTLGNHDVRAGWHGVFAGHGAAPDGPVDQETIVAGVHVIALDSVIPGKVGGALTPPQLEGLAAALERHPDLPKLIALHHPPRIDPNMPFQWEALDAASTEALGALIAEHNVIAVLCGHVHRNRVTLWHGAPVVVTMGQQSALDVTRTDVLSVIEGTGFAICDILPVGLQVTFAPLEVPRRIKEIPAEEARGFV